MRNPLMLVKLEADDLEPTRAHGTDAGLDLRAKERVTIASGKNAMVGTGVSISLPPGHAGFVHPRSGIAKHHQVTVTNAPGTIDEGYIGEIEVDLINLGREPYTVDRGERIAQLIIQKVERPEIIIVDELEATERGTAGHGSTGK